MPALRTTRSIRRKRATVQDIYNKGCKTGGYCPDDVRNKVESKTLADKLLQWLGSFIYLGNLGIGTGKGTGGSGGYNPIGGVTGPKVTSEVTVTRPSIPVDPLGGAQSVPFDVLEPTVSSIVPLSEGGLPEVTVIDSTPDLGPAEIDITTHSQPNQPSTIPHPAIINTEESVLTDFQPGAPLPPRISVKVGFSPTDTVQLNVVPDTVSSYNSNVFIDPQSVSHTVTWGEEIPLNPIPSFDDLEIVTEEPPFTSSPVDTFSSSFRRVTQRARDLYNRYVEQRPTKNVDFLGRPSRTVQFEFENPAFSDNDVTQLFQQDVEEVTAAPDPDFQDVFQLGRLRYSETPEGTIRVSRLGLRGTMKTRSGLQVGKRVHFYYDVSPITPADTVELRSFGQYSGESITLDAQAESTFYDPADGASIYSDEALLDPLSESFERSHIVVNFEVLGETMDMPTIPPGFGLKAYVPLGTEGLHVFYPTTSDQNAVVPAIIDDFTNTVPLSGSSMIIYGESFILPPFLQKRKRKPTSF